MFKRVGPPLYLLLGAAVAWAFYFLQRRVERRQTVDTIERNQKLPTLKQGLEGANTSLDDLRRFETRLIGKAEIAVRIADGYVTQAEAVARQVEVESISHDDMNQQAIVQFQRVDARLDGLVARLRHQLDLWRRTKKGASASSGELCR